MGGLTERIINPARSGSLRARVRELRSRMLAARFPDIAAMSVPDLGGTAGTWRLMATRPARLVLRPDPQCVA
jgi:hypothetical protein